MIKPVLHFRCVAALCIAMATLITGPPLLAAQEERLLDEEPYDEITLDAANENAVLKVVPLELPNRKLPEDPSPASTLRVQLIDRPGQAYQVEWRHIAKVRLFEQMLLEEAGEMIAAEKFETAYDNYAYLIEHHAKLPGLSGAVERYLWLEAGHRYRAGQIDDALARLLELHRRNPDRPGLAVQLVKIADEMAARYAADENYAAARSIVALIKTTVSEEAKAFAAKWEDRFAALAKEAVSQAEQDLAAERFFEARAANRRALAIAPESPLAQAMARRLHETYPLVEVAVTWPLGNRLTNRLDDWAARRVGRLVERQLVEMVDYAAEGGIYTCPFGTLNVDEQRTSLAVQLRPRQNWPEPAAAITGYDVANRLLRLAEARPASQWAWWTAGIAVEDVYRVKIDFGQPHARPETLLRHVTLSGANALQPELPRAIVGPYRLAARDTRRYGFQMRSSYPLSEPGQSRAIIERYYPNADAALSALRRGETTVLARVCPWQLEEAESSDEITVERYALPLLHVLVPHPRSGPLQSRKLRRALLYGIDRNRILTGELYVGREVPGSAVLSGPFPVRRSFEDSLGYASSDQVSPRQYEPALAATLAGIAIREFSSAAPSSKSPDDGKPATRTTLVLAHPPEPVARMACQAIVQYWKRIGIQAETRQQEPGSASSEDYDLRYAQLALWEPMVDVWSLFGAEGIAPAQSVQLRLALRQLRGARNSNQMRDALHEIHRIVHHELNVIPLWQTVEHFAYRRNLQGVGKSPVLLYQNVEAWRTAADLALKSP